MIVAITAFVVIYDFGRNTLQYISPSVDRDLSPRWSPDGSQIAFVRPRRQSDETAADSAIAAAMVDLDLRRRQRFSARNMEERPRPDDSLPLLTEDGSFHFAAKNRIIFSSEQDGWNRLYSVATTGGPRHAADSPENLKPKM